MTPMRTLRIAAAVEAASLVVLLLNALTVHAKPITSLCGPIHGTAYLVALAMTWMAPAAASSRARWPALIPGIGAMLALRRLRNASVGAGAPGPVPPQGGCPSTGARPGSWPGAARQPPSRSSGR
ncbi:DUF3817 domain-containing protein [Streptomyces sp. NPDC048483]|uniref:DUF3817 domain-containing protein n=1 Tax=Streptomyces sp. NPDC048483 TaxID=3154927 RepID=UPI00342E8CC6